MNRPVPSEGSWNDDEGHLIESALHERGFTELSTTVPEQGKWRWATRYGWIGGTLSSDPAELARLDSDRFAYEVHQDAVTRPNTHLADDAVVERWLIHLARAIRDKRAELSRLTARRSARPDRRTRATRDRLRTVRRELALLAGRQRVARRAVADFDTRLRAYVAERVAEARRSCAAEVHARLVRDDDGPSAGNGRLIVAVDASGRGDGACGYGWIAENGELGYGLTIATEIHQAEMIAICQAAVAAELADRDLLILSDNQGCVGLINRFLDQGADTGLRAARHPVPWMRQAYAQRDRIKVVWVRGHSGHILNEAADRLAALAVRAGDGADPRVVTDELAAIRRRVPWLPRSWAP